jgi:hypothetical protein
MELGGRGSGFDFPIIESTKDANPCIHTPPPFSRDKDDIIIDLLKKQIPLERTNYYDISSSIGVALDASGTVSAAQNALSNIDDSRYIREQIFDRIGLQARILNIYNDGPGTWYIRISYDGQQFSDEIALLEGEKKTYYNVYELRHRSDTLGLNYRVTELDIWQQTAVSKAEKIEIYSTDKDLHFTGAIAQNTQETENLTGLNSNRYKIIGVNIQSDQPLHYRLIFWGSNAFNNTDLDQDSFLDYVDLDMVAGGAAFQINGINQYYLNAGDLQIVYEDYDITRQLHISLQNVSAIAKNAGATGEVQIDIKMTPRL